jgi:rRNA-processing protein FCF1
MPFYKIFIVSPIFPEMKKAVLDTSFIISCARQGIDFLDGLGLMGLDVIIPNMVMLELKGLSRKNEGAKLALEILGKKRDMFKESDFGKYAKTTDRAIIVFSEKNPGAFIATLDRDIKAKTANRKIVIRQRKRLKIV